MDLIERYDEYPRLRVELLSFRDREDQEDIVHVCVDGEAICGHIPSKRSRVHWWADGIAQARPPNPIADIICPICDEALVEVRAKANEVTEVFDFFNKGEFQRDEQTYQTLSRRLIEHYRDREPDRWLPKGHVL